jgi:hypothetical protein
MNLCSYGCKQEGIIKNKSNAGYRCANSPNSCPAVKAKKKQNLLDKYGVENISQIESVKEQKRKTNLERYGVENPAQAQVIKDKIKAAWPDTGVKRKKTMLARYGNESYSKTEAFLLSKKATCLEKFGYEHPTQNPDILHKAMVSNAKSEYRTKSMILPSGKEIRYQGYEDRVIYDLLKSGLTENEIITGPGNVPHIIYMFEGKECRYYPDIYIPKYNQLIEVKSKYTWKKYKEKNLAKRKASIIAGFVYNLVIR